MERSPGTQPRLWALPPWGLLLGCLLGCCHAQGFGALTVGAHEGAVQGSSMHAADSQRACGMPPAAANTSVELDFSHEPVPVSPLLHGIFFEEIGHAGEGGLYDERVQDPSFDALALASGFIHSPREWLAISLPDLAAAQLQARRQGCDAQQAEGAPPAICGCGAGRRRKQGSSCGRGNDIIIAWQPLPGTITALTREQPLNQHNPVAMELTSGGTGGPTGILNTGFWGVPVEAGARYALSLYLRVTDGTCPSNVTVSLLPGSAASALTLANATFGLLTPQWQRYSAELVSGTTDYNASLAVVFDGPGRLVLDSVSLFSAANMERGRAEGLLNPWPFRADLMMALRALRPRFLRFPGGCYVEGDWLRGAFRWKATLGRNEERPGHHNSMWGYWSTDGLGLFEYLLLADELGAEPIWVVNNGIAHNDQVPTRDIWPWVQEALDGIEFITGTPNTTWGAVRAAMGRPQPWRLNYLAIGNEGCGLPWDPPNPNYRPFYWQNYNAFFGALKAAHPHLQLVANCQLGDLAPTEIWEYHVYTNPQDLFGRRHAFDDTAPAPGGLIFASEYAVTDGGGQGNLIGAVAEAAFMLGMERNSGGGGAVVAAAYAPLLVNDNARLWPTNLIVFDNRRVFGIPSYHVQQLLSQHLGTTTVDTTVMGRSTDQLVAGATCQNKACDEVAVKLVNFSPEHQVICLRIEGLAAGSLGTTGELLLLSSPHPLDENSFEEPRKVAPRSTAISGVAEQFEMALPAWSLSVLKLRLEPPAATV